MTAVMMLFLGTSANANTVINHTFVIVGAGPAGLQWAHHLRSAAVDYVVLEAGEHAGTPIALVLPDAARSTPSAYTLS